MERSSDGRRRGAPAAARGPAAHPTGFFVGALLGLALVAALMGGPPARRVAVLAAAGADAYDRLPARPRADAPLPPGAAALPREAWAGGAALSPAAQAATLAELSVEERGNLVALCGRCLYHTLANAVEARGLGAAWAFVATGDIPDMWLRDAAVQVGVYLPRAARRPALRRVVEGAARASAFFITHDPYANAFSSSWRAPAALPRAERLLGRGGWVATRNFELDSGAYFLNLLWNYYATPGIFRPETLIADPLVFDAVRLMIDTWTVETDHETASPYRYSELPRDGLGPPTAYTGMIWSAYRPSDDVARYGYNVPGNMYAAGALRRARALNAAVWRDAALEQSAAALLRSVEAGIRAHGVVEAEPGVRVYAYEVDGHGGALADFDDANLPSLLSIPLLGWDDYDEKIYERTRARVLDAKYNAFYFSGPVAAGVGSPHTPPGHVWPLALAAVALTARGAPERAEALRALLRARCGGDGLVHESVSAADPEACTRAVFEWGNAMAVAAVEGALGADCEAAAEAHRLAQVAAREAGAGGEGEEAGPAEPANGGADDPRYYEALEAAAAHGAGARPAGSGGAHSFHHVSWRLGAADADADAEVEVEVADVEVADVEVVDI